MAYQTRTRNPLLDGDVAETIEKRGKELFGLILVCLGALAGAMMLSYAPEDPNWLVSSDMPVQNLLGATGAALAAPLFLIIGWGSFGFAAILLNWGLRLLLHKGAGRAFGRLIFAPIFIVFLSIYAATLEPGADWLRMHSFGLGGHFGDMAMGAILTALPLSSSFGLKLASLAFGIGAVLSTLFVLGFSKAELRRFARFLIVSLIMVYAWIMAALGLGARGALETASRLQARQASRRVVDPGSQASPQFSQTAPNAPKEGILARVSELIKKPTAAQAAPAVDGASEVDPDQARLKAKITHIIKARQDEDHSTLPPTQPALPDGPSGFFPAEPPLTAAPQPQPPAAPSAPPSVMPEGLPIASPRKAQVTPPNPKPIQPSTRAQAEAQPMLRFDEASQSYELPPLSLLETPTATTRHHLSDEALEENARMLETVLDDYGVKGEIVSVRPGPVVTMYELEPAPGLKASRVIGLADDIARSMAALSARVSTVPGRSVIGIELPNESREKVILREILASRDFGDSNMRLPLALGKNIGGDPVVANLAKMPHLLIAGTTGSGKSVAINTMILSLLYRLTPEECRMIMIDPKMLELSVYDGIPHLLSPVVTDPQKAVVALKWVVGEMEERYRKMSKMGVRNIEGYNGRVREALAKGEMFSRTVQTGFDEQTGEPMFETEEIQPVSLPFIVVIVDEMADLMMVAGKEIEACIQRLAQMARASGIHLIMATQRPSVDVITGTIKANFPTRISFQVTSKIDSRTILGEMGAEQLLGMGDMLYMAGGAKISRCHGPFVSDEEVEEIVRHLKAFGPPDYVGGVVDGPEDDKAEGIDAVLGLGGNTDSGDALYDQAVAIAINDRKCSTSYIQRKLAIGYNKAARLVEQMEDEGVISAANHVGKREVLVPEPQ